MSALNWVIRAQKVNKKFRYWSERPTSFKALLVRWSKGQFHLGDRVEFTALNEIDFEIGPGEFVGIMGRNGAGKSTLMKMIAGIYRPSSGRLQMRGRIAPLIELGAGFHHDLSGYENIFLNAAILGFGKGATEQALPAILEFAELGEKIYMPVKNYSSGMLVRLGFAIATHLPAQILLIDEVLAVGDARFQEKCLSKIKALNAQGCTIILVTHFPGAVEEHCTRCIVISDSRKVFDGPPREGAQLYREICLQQSPAHSAPDSPSQGQG